MTRKGTAMPESLQEFPAVYEEYYPKIAGYLRRLVGEADAEDVEKLLLSKIQPVKKQDQ